ncbi:MAG: TolC family protein [Candidatus Binatus sp.]|uniref:TolC family protein n=1 Tax=Candidatus Binatus sp. TaxID=2811406 RepID=UPI003C792131
MLRPAITLLLVALFSVAARAGDTPASPRRISLDDAIAIALRDNRTLKAAGFGSEAARDQIGVARGAMIPRLDAGENVSYTNNPVQVFSDLLLQQDFSQKDFTLDQLNHPGFLSNFQSQVRLSFPLFEGGRLIAAYRAAGFAADAERWQVVQTRQSVEFAVIQSYYSAVLAEQRVAVVDRALGAARAHLAQAQDLFAHGMVVNSDVLRTNVLAGTFEQQRIEADSQLGIAWASLAHALGDEDERLAPLEKPAELDAAISPPSQLAGLVVCAAAGRPEINIADSRMKQAQQAVTIARADYLPTVEVAGVYENDTERFARAGNNEALLVTGRLNLFNGLATQSKVDAAQADLSRARVLADDLRHSVALEVETAYRRLVAAQQGLGVARRDNAYAESALKILEDRYGSGLATNVTVLDAQTAREQADMGLVGAQVSVAIDRAALNLAIGVEPEPASGR